MQDARVKPPGRHELAQLRGLTRLAVDGAAGITDLVDAMHGTVQRVPAPLARAGQLRARGIAGLIYACVRGGIRGSGALLDGLLEVLERRSRESDPNPAAARDLLSAINGIFGDHLHRSGNPLAIPMGFVHANAPWLPGRYKLPPEHAAGAARSILLCVHGLCLNESHWLRNGHDHGKALSEALGWTPLYLRYNTGRTIAENGRELARLLEQLLRHWTEPEVELHVLAHSMGGLVMRSALHQAGSRRRWPARLRSLSFLGTPHFGAPLERGGHGIDRLLGLSPYSAPFVKLGASRSAGITDLRHGTFAPGRTPGGALPPGLAAFAVAATLGAQVGSVKDRLLGDGLVPVPSALGEHPSRDLGIPPSRRWVAASTGHLQLLEDRATFEQLLRWLAPLR